MQLIDSETRNHELSREDLLKELSIGRITFLNFEQKKILSSNIDSSNSLSLLSIEDIEKITGKKCNSKTVWNGKENFHCAQLALHYCEMLGIGILLHYQQEYPELLKQINDPPYLLFFRGNLKVFKNNKSVSVVGTRRVTTIGKVAAKEFAYAAAKDGCNVVSGLANGIDGYAHQGAVDSFFDCMEKGENPDLLGKTIAVLPSGIDEIVPGSHKKLAQQILQSGGLLISEYEPKMQIANWHFVGRNRIIAGLSGATLVVEAPAGSGALITADFALEYNRDVVFHQAAFGEQAQQVVKMVADQLEVEHAAGRVSKYKLENRPEKFLEAGAPVIKDYKDYCECLKEIPGTRINQIVQGTLF